MNKRRYPYEIDMCPQLKIHIGDKQVANGVLRPSKMSEIYERTKQLLFQKAGVSLATRIVVEPVIADHILCDSKPYRQMQLTFDGKLSKPDISIKTSKFYNNTLQKCNYCSRAEKLDFCEKCKDIFCFMCLLSLCSRDGNKICLTCYK